MGALYAVINIVTMASNLGAAPLAERLGVVRVITFNRVLQAMLIVPMVLAPSFWMAGAIYLVRMIAQRVALPLRQSYVMGVIAPEERGTVSAFSNLPSQATMALSPTPAGMLFDLGDIALPFEIGAILQLVNAALFGLFFWRIRPPEEHPDERSPLAPIREGS